MPSLSITGITPVKAADGGFQFKVSVTGQLAFDQKALIEFGTSFGPTVNRTFAVDVSDALRGKSNWSGTLQSYALLGEVLACLGRNQLMERSVKARGVIWRHERDFTASSTVQSFAAPVRSVSAASHRLAEQEFGLTYSGNPNGSGNGSLLFRVTGKSEIAANHYFVHGGSLVTDLAKRGFDCTTFLMAVFGIFSSTSVTSGEPVAAMANKTRILDKVPKADIVADVQAAAFDRTAIIVVFHSAGEAVSHHCVVVRERQVYEFNKISAAAGAGLTPLGSKGGFITDIGKWRSNDASSVYSLYA